MNSLEQVVSDTCSLASAVVEDPEKRHGVVQYRIQAHHCRDDGRLEG
jgi:hypothetical protein